MLSIAPKPLAKETLIFGIIFSVALIIIVTLYLLMKRGLLAKKERPTIGCVLSFVSVVLFLTNIGIMTFYSLNGLVLFLLLCIFGGIGTSLRLTTEGPQGTVLVLIFAAMFSLMTFPNSFRMLAAGEIENTSGFFIHSNFLVSDLLAFIGGLMGSGADKFEKIDE